MTNSCLVIFGTNGAESSLVLLVFKIGNLHYMDLKYELAVIGRQLPNVSIVVYSANLRS